MQYVRQVMCLETGEVTWRDLGDHRPLSEVAESLSFGPRKFRQVLAHVGLVSREWDDRSEQHRYRLTPGAVESGFGIRHDNIGYMFDADRVPFDVLSPLGVDYIRDHLPAAMEALSGRGPMSEALAALAAVDRKRRTPMPLSQKVCWLEVYRPNLSASLIAETLEVSETVVHKYRRRRQRQLEYLRDRAGKALRPKPPSPVGEAEYRLAADDIEAGVQS